ncbi:MAG TPA: DUF134 domain-containing protein [Candidatus Methanomethylophilaceae archaeon]|nr:DUF134 domain-containing protein [Candidatus Methanomethylophilaceae archaeon]
MVSGRGRGRRRGPRWVENIPSVTYFGPPGKVVSPMDSVVLTYAELEAIRLVDLEGLCYEEASARMGISKRTFWSDLRSARVKVATALVNGQAIHIESGDYETVDQRSSKK